MSFKIPFFNVIPTKAENIQLYSWFSTLFGRWSGSDLVLSRLVTIPAWNMDTTATLVVPYKTGTNNNIILKQIVYCNIIIIDDAGTTQYPGGLNDTGISVVTIDGTNVNITRAAGGIFDNVSFSSTASTRGVIELRYST